MRLAHLGLVAAWLAFCLVAAPPANAATTDPETPAAAGQANAAQPAADAPTAQAQPAYRQTTLTGFTRARAAMPLVSEVSGRVVSVCCQLGEPLPADGVFARLEDTFIRLDLQANQVEQKRLASNIAYLQKEAERHRSLVDRRSAPQATLDRLEDQLTQARMQLAGQKTQEQVLAERLSRHQLKGQPGWLVSARRVEPGQWVAQGQEVAQVGDYGTLVVPLALDPTEYEDLRRHGGALSLNLPDLERVVAARVYRVDPSFDPTTRKIGVELALADGLPEQRGGLRAELTLETPEQSGAVVLPRAAVAERYQEWWLTREDGNQVRVVLLGPAGPDLVKVQGAGVTPGQRFRLATRP